MDPGPCTDLDRALGACGTGAAALPPPRPGRVHPCPPRHWAPPEAAQGAQHPQAPKAHTPGGQRPTAGRPNRGRRLCSPADPTAACARRRGGRAAAGHHLLGRRGSAGNAPGRSAIGLPQHPGATTCPSARYRYSCERVPDVAGTCNHAGMLRPPAPCVIMFLPPCLPLAASCSHGPPASPCTYSVHRTCSCPQHRTARSAGTCSARCRRRATTCGAYACVPIAESYGTATLRLVRALLIAYAARRRAAWSRQGTNQRTPARSGLGGGPGGGTGKHHLLRGYAGTGAIEAAMHTIFDPPEDNAPAGPAGPAGPPGPPGNAAMAAAAAAAADGMAVDACT